MKISLRKVLAITRLFRSDSSGVATSNFNNEFSIPGQIIVSCNTIGTVSNVAENVHRLNSISSASFDTYREFYPVNAFYPRFIVSNIREFRIGGKRGCSKDFDLAVAAVTHEHDSARFVKIYTYLYINLTRRMRTGKTDGFENINKYRGTNFCVSRGA